LNNLRSSSKLKRELDNLTLIQLFLASFLLIVFFLIPIFYLMWKAFVYKGSISLQNFVFIFSSQDFILWPPNLNFVESASTPLGNFILIGLRGPDFGIILNSIVSSSLVTIFSVLLGIVTAFAVVRYDFPFKNIIRSLLLVPMLATPFVNAFVIGKFLGPNGLLNYFLYDELHILPAKILIYGLPAIIIIQTISFFPIVFINVSSSLTNLDPTMEEQAEVLGSKGIRLFKDITLPLITPGVTSGATLVFIISLEDLGAPVGLSGAFGSGLHQKLINFYIYSEFRRGLGSTEQVHASTYALAVILIIISTIAFLGIKKYMTLRQYSMLQKGGRFNPRVRKIRGTWGTILALFLLIVVVSCSLPQIGTFILAFTNWAMSGTALPTTFTLKYFFQMALDKDVVNAITNSILYSGVATAIMLVVGISVSYLVSRTHLPGLSLLDTISTMPIAIPGIILALGYLLFFATVFSGSLIDPFVNPGILLIFAYSVRRLPFSARTIFGGLQQTHVSLEEAAMNLGASRFETLKSIVLPLISSNLIGGMLLSFVYSMNEVSTSITLSSLKPQQGPITYYMSQVIYSSGAVGNISVAASLGVLLMSLQIVVMFITNRVLKQRTAFLGV